MLVHLIKAKLQGRERYEHQGTKSHNFKWLSLLTNKIMLGMRDVSIGEVLATQAWGPEFKKPHVAVEACNLNSWEVGIGGSLGLWASGPSGITELQVLWETLSEQNKVSGWRPLMSSVSGLCMHMLMHPYQHKHTTLSRQKTNSKWMNGWMDEWMKPC